MTSESAAPGAAEHPSSDPTSKLSQEEVVVRLVPFREWLLWDDNGRPTLTTRGIPDVDLRGKNGRSVSVIRRKGNRDFLQWRAEARTKQQEWKGDPVFALAKVEALEAIKDTSGRCELKIYADPDVDWLGPNEDHASIVRQPESMARAADRKTRHEVATWERLAIRTAAAFEVVEHCSGADVAKIPDKTG